MSQGIGVFQVAQERPKTVAVTQAPQDRAAQVFKHAELGEDVGDLETARQAQPVDLEGFATVNALLVQINLPTGRGKTSADQVEQGGLACPIRANDGHAFAAENFQVHTANDLCVAKFFRDCLQTQ